MTDIADTIPSVRVARDRPLVFGILNVTPDSFSDGGQWNSIDDAVAHGVELNLYGADVVDVGGESTRPGAQPVGEVEEQERVLPVIEALVSRGVTVSIDTMRASTAALAAEAGATIINDVSGGLADPDMYRVIADTTADYVAMHWPTRDHERPTYADVVTDVRTDLKNRIAELIVWGVDTSRIIVDPGIGFAKNAEDNWRLLGHLDELVTLEHRILVGVSRKRFLAEFAAEGAPAAARDGATATLSALAAQAGAWAVRVHDVESTRATLDVWQAWERGAAL
jgi:dihydropteroate synthase